MTDAIRLEIHDEQFRQGMRDMLGRIVDRRPIMRKIAGIMHDAVEQNFEEEGRPKWDELRPSTIKRREKEGKGSGKILQRSGKLASSVEQHADNDEAAVGTNKVYATTQHFGAKKGQFGKTKRGAPIPWGDIPARPFMMLGDGDPEKIMAKTMEWLKGP